MGSIALSHAKALEALPAAARDQRIIALCDSAISGLNEARDLEEVFGIKNAAEAFATYTRKMKAAVEAQNQCQLVVLLAEARIGAELKAAQERGEVALRESALADTKRSGSHAVRVPRQDLTYRIARAWNAFYAGRRIARLYGSVSPSGTKNRTPEDVAAAIALAVQS